MAFLDTLLIDGHDVRAITGLRISRGYMNLRAPGERRGDDDLIPGDDGEEGNPLPLAKWVINIPIRILGATRGERNDNLSAAAGLLGGWANHGLVTLERRIATGPDDDHAAAFAPGRFITGLSPTVLSDITARTVLQYWQLQAYWLDGDGNKVYT